MLNEKNENSKKLFTCTKLNKYFILPFINPIICFGASSILTLIEERNIKKELFILILYFGRCIIDILVGSISMKEYMIFNKTKNNLNSLKINKTKIFLFLLLISLSLSSIYTIRVFYNYKNLLETRLLYIIYALIFSKLILKISLFKHQIVALIFSLIGFIFLYIPNIIKIMQNKKSYNINIIIYPFFYTLSIVLLKYLLTKYFLSPFFCTFLCGFISLIFCLIFFGFYSFIYYNDLSYFKEVFHIPEKFDANFIFIILLIILLFILKISTLFIINIFEPILYFISEVISPIFYCLVFQLYLEKMLNQIIFLLFYIFSFIFLIISILMFNEIVIVNKWNLNLNTNKYIKQRVLEENEGLLNDKESEDNIELEGYIFKIKQNDDYENDLKDNDQSSNI